jgi:hypothetical protein
MFEFSIQNVDYDLKLYYFTIDTPKIPFAKFKHFFRKNIIRFFILLAKIKIITNCTNVLSYFSRILTMLYKVLS